MKKSRLLILTAIIAVVVTNIGIVNSVDGNISLISLQSAYAENGETWFEGIWIPNSKQQAVPRNCSDGLDWNQNSSGVWYSYPVSRSGTKCRNYSEAGCTSISCHI